MSEEQSWRVELPGRDWIEVSGPPEGRKVRFVGCSKLIQLMGQTRSEHGNDPACWPVPVGRGHHELLLKELILKMQGRWQHPFPHEEVCHCRRVSLSRVEEAIFNGAHSPEMVSRWTSASTSCGTCRPDVAQILAFRLGTP